jgi:hypothetical protein
VWTSAACNGRGPETVNPSWGKPTQAVLPCHDRSPLSSPACEAMATANCGVILRPRSCRTCGMLFWICCHCDRGHPYCSASCRYQGYRQKRRLANQRYQQSPEGRLDHRDRQRALRRRRLVTQKSVTDQSSLRSALCQRMTLAIAFRRLSPGESPSPSFSRWLRCVICGRRGRFVDPYR